jgi:hypothetical protein
MSKKKKQRLSYFPPIHKPSYACMLRAAGRCIHWGPDLSCSWCKSCTSIWGLVDPWDGYFDTGQ